MRQTATHCGTRIPHEFLSIGRTAKITFTSDASIASTGFKLEYKLASCSRMYDQPHDRILSPSWPSRIKANTDCSFKIQVLEGNLISLFFRYMSITTSTNCSTSYLEVRDGAEDSSPLLAKLCGRSIPSTIYSRSDKKTLRTEMPHDIIFLAALLCHSSCITRPDGHQDMIFPTLLVKQEVVAENCSELGEQ